MAAFVEMEVDARLEMNWSAYQPIARGNHHAATAGLAARGNRLVKGRLAIGFAVAHAAVVGNCEVPISESRFLDALELRARRSNHLPPEPNPAFRMGKCM